MGNFYVEDQIPTNLQSMGNFCLEEQIVGMYLQFRQ